MDFNSAINFFNAQPEVDNYTRKENNNLKLRPNKIPYDNERPPYNLFSGQHFVTLRHSIVSMVRKKEGKGSKHVFLTVEHIEEDCYVIQRADLFLNLEQDVSKGTVLLSGQALVCISVKSLSEMQNFVHQSVYKCWKVDKNLSDKLLYNIESDRAKHIAYLNVGNSELYSSINTEKHNCLTWCEEHLTNIGIDISEQQSWLDIIVAHPNNRSWNDEAESTSKDKCWIM